MKTFTSTFKRDSRDLATFDSSSSYEFHLRLIPFHSAGAPRMLTGRRFAREIERVRACIAIDRAAASTFAARAYVRSIKSYSLARLSPEIPFQARIQMAHAATDRPGRRR